MADSYDLTAIRNIGIMAHIDAGKTTTTERILFYSGRVHKMGEVDKGTATMDWMSQEQERGITITSAATACKWKGYFVNIIDTPGHVDFTVEVERSLRVLDGSIGIFCAVAGVQPQSETVWRQADRYHVPRIAYINKMDRVGADFFRVIEMIRKNLSSDAVAIQLPIGVEEAFSGIIDLIDFKAYIYEDESGEQYQERELNPDERSKAQEFRNLLLERLAEYDDSILEKYLEAREISPAEIRSSLRKSCISNQIVPVLCGSSFKNKGVQMLLDAVVSYLPSPLDIPAIEAMDIASGENVRIKPEVDAPLCALAFKLASDPYVGKLTYFRIYSGRIKAGSTLFNSRQDRKERFTRLLKMHANHREEIEEACAGDIVAGVGLKNTATGDTLCSENHLVLLETIDFPQPVIDVAIEAKTRADQERIEESLRRLAEEDPTFQTRQDKESGQMIISGMGELHLEIIIDRLLKEFKVNANIGKPQVAYKESVKKRTAAEVKFDRQAGGRGQYAHVVLEVLPLAEGQGKRFADKSSPEAIPREFIPAVEMGVREALQAGILGGYPVDDVEVVLKGGSYHEVDSNEPAFKIAASMALKEALENAQSVFLEPVMDLEIICPEEYLGDVISDLNARRGRIIALEENRDTKAVKGLVPLAETFGYATSLRSLTQGRASFSMKIKNFAEVPESKSREIIARRYGLPV
ncbi:elongation factor G [Syntrophomonas wolfei]|uniref:Elongation factor G 2 n=1 Tax=Syntrophomonas wolfei subsp. wolfei (strain DSM 2245B / Goettingen) TaxID=335541 RepID=EFG2_SYNWW|nr:elongation factor G [Syntrophomonas wolfei]Q0AUH7.1 RecName: Full=Elongation factor G 2; Short=EF-G 2 [Syntrophomonas wolfei subsp. wolfei str. Goettingen G311]ABI69627.1 translation elongation factor 2 (EF-2/EF-G) [Syntrophomonas wolfei subsp. wolfei str. Goettingen G311]